MPPVLISVIIPSYKRPDAVRRAVRCAQRQRLRDGWKLEIIVVDDGSPGGYRLEGVTYVRHPANTRTMLGYPCAGYTRNTGIRTSRGDYICFLDDDDGWDDRKLLLQVGYMEDTGCKLSCTEGTLVHGLFQPGTNLQDRTPFHRGTHMQLYGHELKDRVTAEMLERRNFVLTSSVVVHRTIVFKAGLFLEDRAMGGRTGPVFLDWDMWKRYVHAAGPFHFIQTPLVAYCGDSGKEY